ncbi:MAG: dihydropteroate synthase [Nitrospinaceae bacterium]|nr:MAG: dihydropteroate synthase [Nitrospinaceae bacterium]
MASLFHRTEGNETVTLMGIINLSPDSFYEQSRSRSEKQALLQAERYIEEGASILDIGAESSRPGSQPIAEELERERLLPVVSRICKEFDIPVSVDTYKPSVAERVLSAGAVIINDITGLQRTPEMAKIIARYQAGVVLMHMQGSPSTMQDSPEYGDLILEVKNYLQKSIALAKNAGIDNIAIDPGIGFGKTRSHNLELIRRLQEFEELGPPVLLGVSRKTFIGGVLDLPVEERLEGSLAAAIIGVMNGAAIIRTHDVRATGRAVKMAQAIMKESGVETI